MRNALLVLRRAPRLRVTAGVAVALGATAAAAAVESRVPPLAERTPFALFYLAVLASSWAGGALPGLVAIVASAAVAHLAFVSRAPGLRPGEAALVAASFCAVAGAIHGAVLALRAAWARQDRLLAHARRRSETLVRTLRARDDFLAVAGHELNTPVTALQLQLEGLARTVQLRRPGFEAITEERLARGLEHLDRLQALVAALLDASHLAGARLTLSREPLDFTDVVGGVVERLNEPAARVGSPISLAHDGPLPGRFDRVRLEQLATHLLANAVKYGMGHPVDVELRRDGADARLSVRDRGIGIAQGEERRIFERFARVAPERNYGGLGLGLWVVRRIVESAGGSVDVQSAPGSGATFTVRLPLSPEVRS